MPDHSGRTEVEMRHQIKSLLAEGMTGVLLLCSLSGCMTAKAAVHPASPEPAQQIEEAAASLLKTASHSLDAGKEETVYVVADAAGKPTETIVSTWLKNPDGAAILEDVTDLTGIQNVKGSETYTQTPDGRITWAADGNDIYYQGKTDRALPVSTKITYALDGKEISPDKLAGKSGHLVIRFEYENHEKTVRQINGKDVTLYQPFTVISGLMMNKDKASNVTVSQGKVIDTGDQSIVLGVAMPGLSESLGLSELKTADGAPLDLNIPDSVCVEADVTDFELLTSLTIISNGLIQDLDLENVSSIDELEDAMNELTSASGKLKDGSEALYNGTSALSNGADELAAGIHKVNDGAVALNDGAAALSDGLGSLSEGAGKLSDGAATLSQGASSAADGAARLNDGLQTLNGQAPALRDGAAKAAEGAKALSEGAGKVNDGAAALNDGIGTLQSSVEGLPAGTKALSEGALQLGQALKNNDSPCLYAGAKQIEDASGVIRQGLTGETGSIKATADQIAQGAQQLSGGAKQLSQGAAKLQQVLGAVLEKAQKFVPLLSGLGIDVSDYLSQANEAYEALGQMKAGADSLSEGLTGEGASIYNAAAGISSGADQLGNGVTQIGAGAKSMEDGIDVLVSDENLGALQTGLNTLADNSSKLTDGVRQLKDGADALQTGTAQLAKGASALSNGTAALSDGAEAAVSGISKLAEGAADLKAGNEALAQGASTMSTGAATLSEGAHTASDGALALSSGSEELKNGTGTLAEGADKLTSGVKELLEGAKELMNGMRTFDEEGIQKLSSLVEDDAKELIDRVKALQELSTEYTSFDGIEGSERSIGKDSESVRFVIRTDSIEK